MTPRSLTTLNDYFGIYALDTFDVTDRLTVTAGGRFNYARIQITNTGDPALDALNGIIHTRGSIRRLASPTR